MLQIAYTAPTTAPFLFSVSGDAGTTYLDAYATEVAGLPNVYNVSLSGEVLVSPTGPLQIHLVPGQPTDIPVVGGSLTSELIRYI
jgi:hypothetical protein